MCEAVSVCILAVVALGWGWAWPHMASAVGRVLLVCDGWVVGLSEQHRPQVLC